MPPKKEKDPNAPKRPLGPYFLFMADERPSVKEEHPDWKVSEIAKELGRRWAEVGDDRKQEYQKKADAAKVEYEKAMERYRAQQN